MMVVVMGMNVCVQEVVLRNQQTLANVMREVELTASILTRVFFDDFAMDARHFPHRFVLGGRGNVDDHDDDHDDGRDDRMVESDGGDDHDDDEDDELQHILAVSMAEMERRND
jgi:hypothetical protein